MAISIALSLDGRARGDRSWLVQSRGVSDDRDDIVYCRLSHRATVLYFALMQPLDLDKVCVYDGSWTEWGHLVGVPVER